MPDPLGPTMATNSPASIVRSTSSSTTGPPGYAKLTVRSSMRPCGSCATPFRPASSGGVSRIGRARSHTGLRFTTSSAVDTSECTPPRSAKSAAWKATKSPVVIFEVGRSRHAM